MVRQIALDTETTGFKPLDGDRIIQIGAVELVNLMPTGRVYNQYINPQRNIPVGATNVHGITDEMVKDAPMFVHIVEDFLNFIEDSPLIIHNADFDMGFLNAELDRLCRPMLARERAIDTIRIARRKFPGSPASLDALCRRFNIDLKDREKHGALIDAELLAKVYLELTGGRQASFHFQAEKSAESGGQGVSEIMNLQKKFRPSRQYKLTEAEKAAHQNFIKGLNNSLWLKSE